MNTKFNMGIHETNLVLYNATRVQMMEEAFSALFCVDHLFEFGFSLTSVDQLRALVDRTGSNIVSTSDHGGHNEP